MLIYDAPILQLGSTLSTDPSRAGHTSSVRLSRGGNRTTGKDPADLPRARGRALFKREWGVNRLKGFRFRSWFFGAPLDLFRSWEGGRSLNQWTLMNHH